jgi:S1-C subfamily serine protease
MARTPLYSRTPSRPATPAASAPAAGPPEAAEAAAAGTPPPRATSRATSTSAMGAADPPVPARPVGPARAGFWRRHERWAWGLLALLLAAAAGWPAWTTKVKPPLTVEQIDAAMRQSIAKEPLPSAAAAAYAAVIPSVVRVVGEHKPPPEAAASAPKLKGKGATKPTDKAIDEDGRSVGTGVVIVDKGLILTNLHVVAGADKITVNFFDGSESEAVLVSLQPEHDLAVLRAKSIPDDLHAATLRSTAGLTPGDEVIAIGFPFGIGPSASQGVISGLKREFRSPEGHRSLSNLIQFDAAANPGNSGGPLVTMDGHVVGIVTAIMNPNQQRTFIGIGFAVPIENAAAAVGMPPF